MALKKKRNTISSEKVAGSNLSQMVCKACGN